MDVCAITRGSAMLRPGRLTGLTPFDSANQSPRSISPYNTAIQHCHTTLPETSMTSPATTPLPPYYAVIFTTVSTDDLEGYAETAERMLELAREQPGYLSLIHI